MELNEAKQKFVQSWGALGSNWGINKTMAQVHALLLISNEPMSTDDIMEELSISRGNTNMNVRALIDWGLVEKVFIPGERKEYFEAEKDMWKVSVQILKNRRHRELEPIVKVLGHLDDVQGEGEDYENFKKVTSDIQNFTNQANVLMEKISRSQYSWFMRLIKKLI